MEKAALNTTQPISHQACHVTTVLAREMIATTRWVDMVLFADAISHVRRQCSEMQKETAALTGYQVSVNDTEQTR